MYVGFEDSVESVCYEWNHVQKVVEEIRRNFDKYFQGFIETLAGERVTDQDISVLKKNWGISEESKVSAKNLTVNYREIIQSAIESFEKDREDYEKIFDAELLEEYFFGNPVHAANEFRIFIEAAQRRQVALMSFGEMTFDLAGIWQVVTSKRHHLKNDGKSLFTKSYEEQTFVSLNENIRDSVADICMVKGISKDELLSFGISKQRLDVIVDQPELMTLTEMLKMMHILRVEPTDITVYAKLTVRTPGVDWNDSFAACTAEDFKTMIQTEEDAYERTENPRHLLNSFTYRGLAGQHLIDKWLLSDDAAQLARDVQGYLDSLQVWQEADHRVARWAMLDCEDIEDVIYRALFLSRHVENRDIFRTPLNVVLHDLEPVLIQALLKRDQARFDKILTVMNRAAAGDSKIMQWANWRTRMAINNLYATFFDDPVEAMRQLERFFTDYHMLTGKPFITSRYQVLLNDISDSYGLA